MLVIAGHDPAGAGVQADIETLTALGCRPFSLITCLTTQNSRGVLAVNPTSGALLRQQGDCLLSDIASPRVCKIGLVPNEECLQAVLEILDLLPSRTPVIVDPVLGATAGGLSASVSMTETLRAKLLPRASLATPNTNELRRLSSGDSTTSAVQDIPSTWCLLKGADEPGETIAHRLFRHGVLFAEYQWPRIEGIFHGSGCTLASAISAFIARGESVASAVSHGLAYTWRALEMATDPGGAQLLPGRPQE